MPAGIGRARHPRRRSPSEKVGDAEGSRSLAPSVTCIGRATRTPRVDVSSSGGPGHLGSGSASCVARQQVLTSKQPTGRPNRKDGPDARHRHRAYLRSHYGLDYDRTTRRRTSGPDAVERDTSGPTTDDAMTRSEEELRVATTHRERGRVRLRKYVTTEQVHQTVPVQRERAGPGGARADHRRQPGRGHLRC
jgi:hypothetical protein